MSVAILAARSCEQMRLDLVERLLLRYPEAHAVLTGHMLASQPDEDGSSEAEFALGWREAVGACLDCGLLAIERGGEWSAEIPEVVLAQGRRAAQDGIELPSDISRYHTAYRLAWDFVLQELHRMDLSDREKMALEREASMAASSLLERLLAELSKVHIYEIKRGARSPAQRRGELIDRALCGEHVDAGELGYDLDLIHTGLIASGAAAQESLRRLAGELELGLLSDYLDEQTLRAWLGAREPICSAEIERALLCLSCPGVSLAIGEPARGLQGFGESHLQAQDAQRVLSLNSAPSVRFIDVGPVALILRDEPRARSFIGAYLGALEGRGERGIRERKTLSAYLAADRNANRAATTLHLSARGVSYRIQKIEDRLGYPVCARRTELTIALRLEELLESRELTRSS